jgi:hypothetical protein
VIVFLGFFVPSFCVESREWHELYSSFEYPVAKMEFTSLNGVWTEYGLIFTVAGENGGIAYSVDGESIQIFSNNDLNCISSISDESNNRILCIFKSENESEEGIYEYDIESQQYSLIENCENPRFIKKLSSGYYCGYGNDSEGNILFSQNGDTWNNFSNSALVNIIDVEENSEGILYIGYGNQLLIESESAIATLNFPAKIMDIFLTSDDNIYLAYNNGAEISGIIEIEQNEQNEYVQVDIATLEGIQNLYQYSTYLVAGCNDKDHNLYLIESGTNGDIFPVGLDLDIQKVYAYEFYPMYCQNFMVSTNAGIYNFYNITSNDDIPSSGILENVINYPNPFNLETTISFNIKNTCMVNVSVFNLKGQKLKTLIDQELSENNYKVKWDGTSKTGNELSSGCYLYKISIDGNFVSSKKCILLK